ncbi:MAG: sigma-54 interaction domain-containing protein [Syntrophobacteraceae bacterium]
MEALNFNRVPPQLLQAVLDNPFEGMVIIDHRGVIWHFSRANEPFYGITAEDAMGRHIRDVVPTSSLPEVLRSGKPVLGDTFDIKGRKVIVNNYPIRLGEKIIGAVGKMIFHNLNAFVALKHKIGQLESAVRRYELEIRQIYRARYSFEDVIGRSAKLDHARDAARRLAASASPILLTGESGTGKEIFAHAIHQASPRRDRSFIRVNCASIPAELFESELFGYRAGAFTGALKSGKPGKFELAHRGTIFLDEIGDLPLTLQAKLLRVLQEKEIEPLGAASPKAIDFRVIAATNRDLEERVRAGYFRRDLFYRLNVIAIQLPPLREIPEDIPVLADHFLTKLRQRISSPAFGIAPEVIERFRTYDWPGNVRELENVMERALALCQGAAIEHDHLPESLLREQLQSTPKAPAAHPEDDRLPFSVDDAQKEQLLEALRRVRGNRTEAAALLNIHRTTLYFRLKKHGIAPHDIGIRRRR